METDLSYLPEDEQVEPTIFDLDLEWDGSNWNCIEALDSETIAQLTSDQAWALSRMGLLAVSDFSAEQKADFKRWHGLD